MNINDNAKTILCYGDSNTYGQRSDDVFQGRWPARVRWTGGLQQLLGDDYYIIEEGFSGRTTDLDSAELGCNGRTYLAPCLQSHSPVDVVVLMLGTNDCKVMYDRSEDKIARAIEGLVNDIETFAPTARIILVSPIHINNRAPQFDVLYHSDFDHESVHKLSALGGLLRKVASRRGLLFLDASEVACTGDDGVHFDEAAHMLFAKRLAALILSEY